MSLKMESANLNKTKERIKEHEGCVLKIYDDPILGAAAPTIFYGHLCVPSDPWEPGQTYTMDDAERVFEEDIEIASDTSDKFIGDVDVPDIVRSIVTEVAFNIGEPRLMGFRLMRSAIQDQDYVEAARQLKDSKLYRQLKNRYDPLVEEMRNA